MFRVLYFIIISFLTNSAVFAQENMDGFKNQYSFVKDILDGRDNLDLLGNFSLKESSHKKSIYFPKEYKKQYIQHDFSEIWTDNPENDESLGFIGDDYQRLYMKILSAKKDPRHPDTYSVSGKSKVKDNVCEFKGSFQIQNIRIVDTSDLAEDFINKYIVFDLNNNQDTFHKIGLLIVKYKLFEESSQNHAGIFEGYMACGFYFSKKNIQKVKRFYLEPAEGDQQCVGIWKSYDGKITKRCNWGLNYIQEHGDLRAGDCCFYINANYRKNGWETFSNCLEMDENACKIEDQKWWK